MDTVEGATAVETTTTTVETPAATTTTTQTPKTETTATTTTEAATEVPKEDATQTTPEPKPEAPQVPEKYEIKASEKTLLTSEQITKVEEFAKTHKLTNDQAQALLTGQETAVADYHNRVMEAHNNTVKGWAEASKNDQEFGGEKYNETIELSKRALDKFASKDFMTELETTGFANHPEVIRVFSRIGRAMGEGGPVLKGNNDGTQKKSASSILYDKT